MDDVKALFGLIDKKNKEFCDGLRFDRVQCEIIGQG